MRINELKEYTEENSRKHDNITIRVMQTKNREELDIGKSKKI
jgi:hypothetical protein